MTCCPPPSAEGGEGAWVSNPSPPMLTRYPHGACYQIVALPTPTHHTPTNTARLVQARGGLCPLPSHPGRAARGVHGDGGLAVRCVAFALAPLHFESIDPSPTVVALCHAVEPSARSPVVPSALHPSTCHMPRPTETSFDPYPRLEEEEFFFRGQSTILDNVKTMKITDCFITPREMVRVRVRACMWACLVPVLPVCLPALCFLPFSPHAPCVSPPSSIFHRRRAAGPSRTTSRTTDF